MKTLERRYAVLAPDRQLRGCCYMDAPSARYSERRIAVHQLSTNGPLLDDAALARLRDRAPRVPAAVAAYACDRTGQTYQDPYQLVERSGGQDDRLGSALALSDPRPGSGTALIRLAVGNAAGTAVTRASTLPATTNAWHSLERRERLLRRLGGHLVKRIGDQSVERRRLSPAARDFTRRDGSAPRRVGRPRNVLTRPVGSAV